MTEKETEKELIRRLYGEFMKGLHIKFHMSYFKSTSFAVIGKNMSWKGGGFEEAIVYKVDSEAVLGKLKNKNMAEALCLIAQGYEQWEVAIMMGKSIRTIEWYVQEVKRFLKKFQ
jgi:hypothetical protein